MSPSIPKPQYVIHILDSRIERAAPTIAMLKEAGFSPLHFSSAEELLATLKSKPPHTVIVHRSDEELKLTDVLKNLHERLPETHFLVLSSAGGLAGTWRDWGHWIYDCVLSPPVHPRQLIQAVERAAELDALVYRAEDLTDQLTAAKELLGTSPRVAVPQGLQEEIQEEIQQEIREEIPEEIPEEKPEEVVDEVPDLPPPSRSEADDHPMMEIKEDAENFLAAILEEIKSPKSDFDDTRTLLVTAGYDFGSIWSRLNKTKSLEEMVREAMLLLAASVGEAPAVFLRYLPNRRCLVTSAAHRLPAEAWKGLGLNLSEEPDFRISDLRHPEKLPGLREMAQSLANTSELWVRPLIIRDEVHGLFVVLASADQLPGDQLEAIIRVCEEHGQLLDLKSYLHSIEVYDSATMVLNRASVDVRVVGEIARARRIQSPVSLMILALDQYRDLLTQYGIEEAQMALRALGKIIAPRIRMNDVLGKFSAEELVLVLPHTASQGAVLKAERLRRMIATADFGRLLPKFPKLTMSLGVSEYPACCRDANDLFTSADDALWQIKNKTPNKVCVATPMPGFVPDFVVPST